ncbi:hypothetical protein HSBAA_23610 [Vreelandella sulfidaeris]|uniref:Menbrane protein HflK N-terminal domain-containing protein n=1 Tax=Vreelandella sulfidaeris TaxID=115553 RepID=A0A455U541_9GAMM|nr:hypothetical protein HSBAA_23610 [Halomonas sulfidaeris]
MVSFKTDVMGVSEYLSGDEVWPGMSLVVATSTTPWSSGGRRGGKDGDGNRGGNNGGNNGNKGGNNQGPPDLDEALKKFQDKLNNMLGGGKKGGGKKSGEAVTKIATPLRCRAC